MQILKKDTKRNIVYFLRDRSPKIQCRMKAPGSSEWIHKSTGKTDLSEAEDFTYQQFRDMEYKTTRG